MNEEVVAALCGVVFLMIPIVAILTRHQQTMARIIHEQGNRQNNDQLRQDVEQLKQMMVAQTIALDNLSQQHRQLLATRSESVDTRLNA